MPVTVDNEKRAGELFSHWVTRVDPKHEVWRKIRTPGACVAEIVFCVERIVADETAENTGLDRQAPAHWRKIRDVRRTEVSQPTISGQIWCCSRKPKNTGIL